ncbi:MAG: hypothetical protein K0Q76_2692 [Panacagrimonas sp.]|jgi:uncharacterized protein (TIGR00730 family)|nr:TIGR00730 family Rossman fold protein [Panacagrimonas sp.]MCC2657584.1 hypothetical protein [Panacagrimonas sp.]
MSRRDIGTVAVFCGSNVGASTRFADAARSLGRLLGESDVTLVYGGTAKGLMGVLADAVLDAGGTVHGVVTEGLHDIGQSHPRLTRHEIIRTLHDRKARMIELADAFIALPGGIGTLEELMVVWTMNQLAEIDKPVGVLNTAEFFTPLLAFLDHMVATRFLPEAHRRSICIDSDPAGLMRQFVAFERTAVEKWL